MRFNFNHTFCCNSKDTVNGKANECNQDNYIKYAHYINIRETMKFTVFMLSPLLQNIHETVQCLPEQNN